MNPGKRTSARATTDQPDPLRLAAIFKECGIQLSQRQIDLFWIYHGLLRRHNPDLNLTRIHNFTNMVLKLYVDSVLPGRMMPLPSPLMDLGSGPGMPGIPLKILHTDVDVWLAEGRAKRTAFLGEVIDTMGLTGIHVIDAKITPAFTQPMAAVITRAVESIDQTLERVSGCLRQGGQMIFMKGPQCADEIEQGRRRFSGQFRLIQDQAYAIGRTSHQRRLVVFERLDAPPHEMAGTAARRHKVHAVTSTSNQQFKDLKKLLVSRGIKKAGRAIMSGARPVQEMLSRFPERCLSWITRDDLWPPGPSTPAQMNWLQLCDPLFHELDIFGTHGPLLVIAVPPMEPWDPREDFPPGCSLLVPFQDPENIGTVIRSAAAFGVSQVILPAESAHPYHPKALRAAGGMTPLVRLRTGPPLEALGTDLPLLALSAEGTPLQQIRFPESFGLLAGLEGQGLPDHWRAKAVRIPIDTAVESLNAATAVAIALYEWRRQH
jgi:16S rRNA (guanine(527)-N(7))-methyltransferase RsmG